MKAEMDSLEFKAKADAYWEPIYCRGCGAELKRRGQAVMDCEDCDFEPSEPRILSDFGNRGED